MALSHAFSSPIADQTGTVTNWDGATTASAIASQLVRPTNWNEPHVGYSTFAGNTAGASTWSGTNLIMAAVTNLTLSYSANAVSIVGPDLSPYLTTAALSNHSHGNPTLALTNISGTTASNSAGLTLSLSAGAGGAGSLNVSAGTTSNNLTAITFDNSNGVSFGLNGSVVTATVKTDYLTTAAVSNHSHGASGANGSFGFQTLSFSNAQGVSFATSAGSAIVASVETSYAASNHSHGNPTLALTNISGTTASNSAGLTLSLSAAAPGGGAAGNTISYFANIGGTYGVNQASQSTSMFSPFWLPSALSASYIRLIASIATNSTSTGTSANTTLGLSRASTINAVVYVQGTGASSVSLTSYASASAGFTHSMTLGANANGSEYTVGQSLSYPGLGGTTSTTFSYASSQTRFDFLTSQLSNFSGIAAVDLPFATSLAGSNYWMGIGMSTTASVLTGNINLGNFVASISGIHAGRFSNAAVNLFGVATASSVGWLNGIGSFSTAGGGTTDGLPLSAISSAASHPQVFFQMIRQA